MSEASTETLVGAVRILARITKTPDGVANAAMDDAADRLEAQERMIGKLKEQLVKALEEVVRLSPAPTVHPNTNAREENPPL